MSELKLERKRRGEMTPQPAVNSFFDLLARSPQSVVGLRGALSLRADVMEISNLDGSENRLFGTVL
eukprot:CAMPEP_0119410878 /NCGR_PEP_ID=MMETSP1335-20130426/3775_1 /TAXON_ID=259385 /ORGANISM="Chrysoculter rhomboideus, Strain RCC1486" /LENGTH=65 /DNA_ID=CAMNT_0007435469 /DNA_START=724 /DNA_END=921 /DNA_ORIENTATION=+